MKLVASRDIYNVSRLSITPDADQVHKWPVTHKNHVHKGTRFTIGTSEKHDELSPAEQEKILWLHHSKAAVQAGDKAVERIDREVKLDLKKQSDESVKPPSVAEMIAAAVTKALAEAGVAKAPAPSGK